MIDDKKVLEIMDNLSLDHDASAGGAKLPENTDLTLVKVEDTPRTFEGTAWYAVIFSDKEGNQYDKSLKSLIQGAEGLSYSSRKLSERIKAWYGLSEQPVGKKKFHFERRYEKMVTLKNKDSVTINGKTYRKGEEMPINTDVFKSRLVG